MGREDAILALDRHATSKIRSAADLVGVARSASAGRRCRRSRRCPGSCCSPARRAAMAPSSRVTGGRLDRVETAARQRGTTVTVRNLFFNTPARRKFLRSTASEARAAHDAVATLALAHPDRGFELEVDGSMRLRVPPAQSREERLAGVWGRELAATLVPVDLRGRRVPGGRADPAARRTRPHRASHPALRERPSVSRSVPRPRGRGGLPRRDPSGRSAQLCSWASRWRRATWT